MEYLTVDQIDACYYLAGRKSNNEMKFGQIPYTLGRGHIEQRKNTPKRGGLLRVWSEFGFLSLLEAHYENR